jgi:hypothetical protein
MRLPDRPLAAQAVDQPDALIGLEPARLLGAIGRGGSAMVRCAILGRDEGDKASLIRYVERMDPGEPTGEVLDTPSVSTTTPRSR